jgi:threonylcarbamoyladenosine tRNA methylthiotransferase MtaB
MKVFFDTVGCRLNQAEIERMAAEFRLAGHEIIESPNQADLVIINSCAVTAAATSDSRQKVRQAYNAGAASIVLTGCWATVSPQAARELPGITHIFSNEEKQKIPQALLGRSASPYELEPLERKPLPGAHHRTRAFIKVQDGCDNHCTFCITRVARGRSRSVPRDEILTEVRHAESGGTHEVVLTGVNLGAWGKDLGMGEGLADLVSHLLAHSKVERLRLSSIEPWDMDAEFLSLWNNLRLCNHLHIPLQSGCEETLKRMGRKTSPDQFRKLIGLIRQTIPDVAITTDVIVGFAGESETEFNDSLTFVREMEFVGGHVFRFSPREGTPAWDFQDRVNGRIAHLRSQAMRDVLLESEYRYWRTFVGRKLDVLWESSVQQKNGQWKLHGLTSNYLPVLAHSTEDRWNRIDTVLLEQIGSVSLEGKISG